MIEETDRSRFERLANRADEHHRAGQLSEAEVAYKTALSVSPENPVVLHNLGVLSATRRDLNSALSYFDRAIAAKPSYILAQFSRAKTLRELGSATAAIAGFARVCDFDPDHYGAHHALAFLWLGTGHRGRAMDHFARTYELRRQHGTIPRSPSLTSASKYKLQHDADQLRFLSQQRSSNAGFIALAHAYEVVAEDFPTEVAPLSVEQLRALGDDYNTAIHIGAAPEVEGPAVHFRPDSQDLLQQLAQRGVVYFDNFLTDKALLRLRKYLLESTIWHDFRHIQGLVASYLEDGLACPLMLQIVDEVRAVFHNAFAGHCLSQAWAFKGLDSNSQVEAHADDAAYSLNFWLTPDTANLDPEAGGMIVCRKAPPPNWQLTSYDSDRDGVVSFLRQNSNHETKIPYRENRAVLFSSKLFHYSDRPKFSSGYVNRRINMTLLFNPI